MFSDAEELICALYGKPRFKNVNELRFHLLKAKCGSEDKITNSTNADISNMPPVVILRESMFEELITKLRSGNEHM